jgi:hypothetical protein
VNHLPASFSVYLVVVECEKVSNAESCRKSITPNPSS